MKQLQVITETGTKYNIILTNDFIHLSRNKKNEAFEVQYFENEHLLAVCANTKKKDMLDSESDLIEFRFEYFPETGSLTPSFYHIERLDGNLKTGFFEVIDKSKKATNSDSLKPVENEEAEQTEQVELTEQHEETVVICNNRNNVNTKNIRVYNTSIGYIVIEKIDNLFMYGFSKNIFIDYYDLKLFECSSSVRNFKSAINYLQKEGGFSVNYTECKVTEDVLNSLKFENESNNKSEQVEPEQNKESDNKETEQTFTNNLNSKEMKATEKQIRFMKELQKDINFELNVYELSTEANLLLEKYAKLYGYRFKENNSSISSILHCRFYIFMQRVYRSYYNR